MFVATPVVCRNCKRPITRTDEYCPGCGLVQKNTPPTAPAATPAPQPTVRPYYPEPRAPASAPVYASSVLGGGLTPGEKRIVVASIAAVLLIVVGICRSLTLPKRETMLALPPLASPYTTVAARKQVEDDLAKEAVTKPQLKSQPLVRAAPTPDNFATRLAADETKSAYSVGASAVDGNYPPPPSVRFTGGDAQPVPHVPSYIPPEPSSIPMRQLERAQSAIDLPGAATHSQ